MPRVLEQHDRRGERGGRRDEGGPARDGGHAGVRDPLDEPGQRALHRQGVDARGDVGRELARERDHGVRSATATAVSSAPNRSACLTACSPSTSTRSGLVRAAAKASASGSAAALTGTA